jgi:hypothetical protein
MTATVAEVLDRLGKNADQVAESLNVAGITGRPADPCECAVSRYLESLGFESVAVMNSEFGYSVETSEDFHTIGDEGPVADFIRAFDDGQYPHLVRKVGA